MADRGHPKADRVFGGDSGRTSASNRSRKMQARIVRAPARATKSPRPCADPRPQGAAVPHREGYSSALWPASVSAHMRAVLGVAASGR